MFQSQPFAGNAIVTPAPLISKMLCGRTPTLPTFCPLVTVSHIKNTADQTLAIPTSDTIFHATHGDFDGYGSTCDTKHRYHYLYFNTYLPTYLTFINKNCWNKTCSLLSWNKHLTRSFLFERAEELGKVNGWISDRAEIQTTNFQLQYLLQLYSKNLTIMLEPFTGTLWMGLCWSRGSMSGIWISAVRGSAIYPTPIYDFRSWKRSNQNDKIQKLLRWGHKAINTKTLKYFIPISDWEIIHTKPKSTPTCTNRPKLIFPRTFRAPRHSFRASAQAFSVHWNLSSRLSFLRCSIWHYFMLLMT